MNTLLHFQELEERERSLNNALTRTEMSVETLTRENRYQNERIKEIELKTNHLDLERSSEEQNKKIVQRNMVDVVKRLATALGAEPFDGTSIETVTHKASELIQVTLVLTYQVISITGLKLFCIREDYGDIHMLGILILSLVDSR